MEGSTRHGTAQPYLIGSDRRLLWAANKILFTNHVVQDLDLDTRCCARLHWGENIHNSAPTWR